MIEEIISKYETFSDALILSFTYNNGKGLPDTLDIVIRCMNKANDHEFEIIKLSFIDIISMRFMLEKNRCSTLIMDALIKVQDDAITIDFFPQFFSKGDIRENEESDFKVKCKRIEYSLVEQ